MRTSADRIRLFFSSFFLYVDRTYLQRVLLVGVNTTSLVASRCAPVDAYTPLYTCGLMMSHVCPQHMHMYVLAKCAGALNVCTC